MGEGGGTKIVGNVAIASRTGESEVFRDFDARRNTLLTDRIENPAMVNEIAFTNKWSGRRRERAENICRRVVFVEIVDKQQAIPNAKRLQSVALDNGRSCFSGAG